jgi:hypothetical protein
MLLVSSIGELADQKAKWQLDTLELLWWRAGLNITVRRAQLSDGKNTGPKSCVHEHWRDTKQIECE